MMVQAQAKHWERMAELLLLDEAVSVFIEAVESVVESQDMYIALDTNLIACKTVESRLVFNSATHTCVKLKPLTLVEVREEKGKWKKRNRRSK